METFREKHGDKLRYLLVGGFNTLLDFIILFGLVALGLNKIPANYISTTITMIISFFLNKEFTFKSDNKATKRQFFIFLSVTAFGLWAIQPVVILVASWFLDNTGLNDTVILFISKVLATVASLIWNYLFYSRLVFKKVP
ncbi:MAG: sugar translocase [Candidatus Saccharibacteria bacterium]|nr:sugar translocase [Candidatus Saccharibacteria bacterium]MDB5180419.1 sugar translocase [Candidatus Saccharibacteria bacterium]